MALVDLLPDFAGDSSLDKRATTTAELTANGDRLAIGRLLSDLELGARDLEAAVGNGGETALVALRAGDLSGEELAAAYVDAAMEVLPGASLTEVDVDPLVLQRIVAELDRLSVSVTVLPLDDAIVIATAALPEHHDLVELTLWRMLHPGPEGLLPRALDDRPMQIVAMPGEAWPNSGDVCSYMCPGELQDMAAAAGLQPTDIRVGFALLEDAPQIAVLAFEFPGVTSDDLFDLRDDLAADPRRWQRSNHTVAGKQVRRHQQLFGNDPVVEQWIYATDGVLFVVYVDPREKAANRPLLEEAFAALP